MNQRGSLLAVLAALITGCRSSDRATTPAQPSLEPWLTFLTRGECVNTPAMRASLDQALSDSGFALEYVVIDTATLPATDPRCGYGTPTILLDGHDLFGLADPAGGTRYVPM